MFMVLIAVIAIGLVLSAEVVSFLTPSPVGRVSSAARASPFAGASGFTALKNVIDANTGAGQRHVRTGIRTIAAAINVAITRGRAFQKIA